VDRLGSLGFLGSGERLMPDFLLPDLGEGLTEAEIVAWHVQVGDIVAIDQMVVEVETAKAAVEVPVPFAGRVTVLHAAAGEVLTVGLPLITVENTDDLAEFPASTSSSPARTFFEPGVVTPDPTSEDGSAPDRDESGSVLIGYGTSSSRRRRPRGRAAHEPAAASVTPPAAVAPSSDRIAVVSPLVRRLARDAGLDLRGLSGSGPRGLITRSDVEQAISKSQSEPTPDGIVRIPIHGLRKTVADKLSRSRREIPEATVWVDVDASGLMDLRRTLNSDSSAPKIGLLALLSRFTILGLHRYPELNARIEDDEILMGSDVNLGFAAQTDRGLMVPVIHAANEQSLEELSASFAQLTGQARDGKLGTADLTGGTFTINNYGVFGVDGSAAIINHPEVAILGIGRIIPKPWIVEGEVKARLITQLTLAFDHRVCDGGIAGGFLRFVADCVETPARALRHL
jgi:2-oxoisovalerate dehydrogenase E2 component (dihydrolipoyl transacylase)